MEKVKQEEIYEQGVRALIKTDADAKNKLGVSFDFLSSISGFNCGVHTGLRMAGMSDYEATKIIVALVQNNLKI